MITVPYFPAFTAITVTQVPTYVDKLNEHRLCKTIDSHNMIKRKLGFRNKWQAVLRIRDILVRIRMRIRILGSVTLTNGSGFGSFRQ
jgi:hypothetical protein